MAKRFINPDWKALRKLNSRLREAFFYCWDKADACGVYELDKVYMKADLGFSLSIAELSSLPQVSIHPGEKIFFKNFIEINYGELKENYNPHKPAFRALSKHNISSLNQACPKLEEEGEEEDKEEEEGEEEKEGVGRKRFKPPNAEEVAAYMAEINYPALVQEESETFIDHYTGNGWMRGKNKVKDWKSVVRTWKRRKSKEKNESGNSKTGRTGGYNNASDLARNATNSDLLAEVIRQNQPAPIGPQNGT